MCFSVASASSSSITQHNLSSSLFIFESECKFLWVLLFPKLPKHEWNVYDYEDELDCVPLLSSPSFGKGLTLLIFILKYACDVEFYRLPRELGVGNNKSWIV